MNLFSCGCLKKFHTESTHESVMVSYCEKHKSKDLDALKPFDITKHEWSDVIAEIEAESGHTLVLKFKGSWISLDKDDAIAIAKDRGLTAEDLK